MRKVSLVFQTSVLTRLQRIDTSIEHLAYSNGFHGSELRHCFTEHNHLAYSGMTLRHLRIS